jgi:hypothetical protein
VDSALEGEETGCLEKFIPSTVLQYTALQGRVPGGALPFPLRPQRVQNTHTVITLILTKFNQDSLTMPPDKRLNDPCPFLVYLIE